MLIGRQPFYTVQWEVLFKKMLLSILGLISRVFLFCTRAYCNWTTWLHYNQIAKPISIALEIIWHCSIERQKYVYGSLYTRKNYLWWNDDQENKIYDDQSVNKNHAHETPWISWHVWIKEPITGLSPPKQQQPQPQTLLKVTSHYA